MKERLQKLSKLGGPAAIVSAIALVGFSSYNCQKANIKASQDHIKELLEKDKKHLKELLEKDKKHLKELFEAKLDPINEQLNNHISDLKRGQENLNKRIDNLYERLPSKK